MSTEQAAPLHRALAAFGRRFGGKPLLAVRAPGRVNLIGEHTDYSDGFCLPCAIDRETVVVLRPAAGDEIHVHACDEADANDHFRIDAPIVPGALRWANYVRGTLAALQSSGLRLRGAELAIAGNVPLGAGLSSSAALEVATATAFNELLSAGLSAQDMALAGQRAEHTFAGCQCGIMDQLVSAAGVAGHALLLDCRTLQAQAVALPRDTAVLVIHSRVQRGLVDSEYNLRRQQCQQAAAALGVPMLRDVTPALEGAIAGLGGDMARRARHVVSENRRTLQAVQALAAGDLAWMGELMRESHVSMRDDFDIVPPALDQLAGIVNRVLGKRGGARMTGGGFGGCVVALAPADALAAVTAAVAADYRSPDGQAARVWLCRASGGAGRLEIGAA